MSTAFAVGKPIVCISAFKPQCELERMLRWKLPQVQDIYTPRALILDPADGELYFLLEEIRNVCGKFGEQRFWSRRFRQARETSLDCFTALLETPPVKEREPAL